MAATKRAVFVLSTNGGLEDVLASEAATALGPNIPHTASPRDGLEGLVFVDVEDSPPVRAALSSLRSAYYVLQLTAVVDLPQGPNALAELCVQLTQSQAGQLLPDIRPFSSFRVRSSRIGIHTFRSVDVERSVGEVLHEGSGVPGKMKGAEVIVRADVIGARVVLGLQLHNDELTKRLHPVFIRDASVRPNVAYALLHLAGVRDGFTVLDPFVGSGTIILEAAVRFPNCKLYGVEKSERVVAGAVGNAESLGLASERLRLVSGNARTLHKYVERGSVDAIVTNPPWGIRVGKSDDVDDLYRGFLASAADVMRVGGRLVVLVVRWEGFLQHSRQSGRWEVKAARPVRTGDMLPVVFVLERVEDAFWTTIKQEIHRLVKVAKEGDGCPEDAPLPKPADAADDSAKDDMSGVTRKRRVSQ